MSLPLTWLEGGLTAVGGLSVGHAEHPEGPTGVTAILFDVPVPGGVDLAGGATGTRQFNALDPAHVAGRIHGVVFAGGSAYGLDAGGGAVRWLAGKGRGLPVMPGLVVPVVPTAIVFDIGLTQVRPDADLGEAACRNATAGPVGEGSVGAGAGATVGKCAGHERAMKGGVGSAAARLPDGTRVGALAVVNAFGDVVDPATRAPLAGVRVSAGSRDLAGSRRVLLERGHLRRYRAEDWETAADNTTLVLVAVDTPLTRLELTGVARLAGHGMVRALDPCHLPVDGDLVIAVSTTGEERHPDDGDPDATVVGLAAAEVVSESILRAVRPARGLPGLPGLADAP